ncbi:BnaA06g01480D [Brassica napus]|uniref:BnaA06g01480D protein n=2 Tax=Brassica TaxID=3705 RepID=A0A078J9L1_BRANA|nr:BnaA06g01480D [Brassica napus]VDC64840.1 unnamed protein product [Brassica rapa]
MGGLATLLMYFQSETDIWTRLFCLAISLLSRRI